VISLPKSSNSFSEESLTKLGTSGMGSFEFEVPKLFLHARVLIFLLSSIDLL